MLRILLAAAISCVVFSWSPRATATIVDITITQQALVGGGSSFLAEGSTFWPSTTITAPSGATSSGPFNRVTYAAPDLASALAWVAGDWLISYAARGRPSPEVHRFSVGSFTASSVEFPRPEIVAPVNGATVSPMFLVDWEYPGAAAEPSGRAVAYSPGSRDGAWGDFSNGANSSSWEASVTLPGGQPLSVTFRAGASRSLVASTPAVFQGAGTPSLGFRYAVVHRHYSTPITVNVVPEPTGVALALAAGLFACGRLRW
jgi:hypothetical protein